jgi:hypothetical protein
LPSSIPTSRTFQLFTGVARIWVGDLNALRFEPSLTSPASGVYVAPPSVDTLTYA